MKLDDLRPCDGCGGPVNPIFFRIVISHMAIDQTAVRQRVGMGQFFGNSSLASVFDAFGDDAIKELPGKTLLLCTSCFCDGTKIVAAWGKETP